MTRSRFARAKTTRRQWAPESDVTIQPREVHACHVCGLPTDTNTAVHRLWSVKYAHPECAAANPKHWHEDITAACWDCRQSFPLRELVESEPGVRRCALCAEAVR